MGFGSRSAASAIAPSRARRGVAFDSLVSRSAGSATGCSRRRRSSSTAQPGSPIKLHTYHLVREDQQSLFGFRSAEDLGFFTLLLTVTGVGPKVALAIVGSRPTPDLQLAIMAQDQAVLVSIPGIGKKLADRIIFELKEKVAAAGVAARRAGAVGVGAGGERGRRGAPGARLLAGRGPRGVADRPGRPDDRRHARGPRQGRAAEPPPRVVGRPATAAGRRGRRRGASITPPGGSGRSE